MGHGSADHQVTSTQWRSIAKIHGFMTYLLPSDGRWHCLLEVNVKFFTSRISTFFVWKEKFSMCSKRYISFPHGGGLYESSCPARAGPQIKDKSVKARMVQARCYGKARAQRGPSQVWKLNPLFLRLSSVVRMDEACAKARAQRGPAHKWK